MSSTLMWQIKPKSCYKCLPFALKVNLEQKFNFPCIVSFSLIPYLEGLESCGIEGAKELIELIKLYEEIELNLEY